MKTSLWIVVVVVVFFIGLLVGYSLAPINQTAPGAAPAATDKPR